jgi:hypothetical protein
MLWRCRCPGLLWAAVAFLPTAPIPVLAFDDKQFCGAVRQLAVAAEQDVGLWTDRTTRNAGISVSCDRKLVEFRRFTYAPSASMDDAWRERNAEQWNATHCNNTIWSEAIRNSWNIALVVSAADGGQVRLRAQCK